MLYPICLSWSRSLLFPDQLFVFTTQQRHIAHSSIILCVFSFSRSLVAGYLKFVHNTLESNYSDTGASMSVVVSQCLPWSKEELQLDNSQRRKELAPLMKQSVKSSWNFLVDRTEAAKEQAQVAVVSD